MRTRLAAAVGLVLGALASAPAGALAQALVPGPGEAGFDAALEAKAAGYERQIHGLLTPPLGWGLEAYIGDPADRALVDGFIASGEADFQAFAGVHPYEVIDQYEEFGDLGMFGGLQAAGDAFRYAVLRDGGAPAAEVDLARERLLRAFDGLHWYTRVTGAPGVIARGLRRVTPEAGEPPLPGGPAPATTPLFDGSGNPLPVDKTPTWRDDASGELPFLIWYDDTSKDQFDGYVLALGAVHDVAAGDPTIPSSFLDRLGDDARAIGARLMEKVEVFPGRSADLVIQDADGRPTRFHDMSAEEVAPNVVFDAPTNGFNGWMALSVMRTLYHVSGDEPIGRFYYEDLVAGRAYLDNVEQTIASMYTGSDTNFSNVNMAMVAAYGLLRYEPDPEIASRVRSILASQLYAPGVDRDADDSEVPFFDLLYAGFSNGGATAGEGADALADGLFALGEAPAAPYWDDAVENCDAAELASLDCVAPDGTPMPLSPEMGWNGGVVALAPVPPRLRPPSNFEPRSDPHSPNGGGSTRLNPGAGFYTAYWMGRFLGLSPGGVANVSPIARTAPPPLPGTGGGGGAGATTGAGGGEETGGGCGCRVGGAGGATAGAWWWVVGMMIAALGRRRQATGTATRPRATAVARGPAGR